MKWLVRALVGGSLQLLLQMSEEVARGWKQGLEESTMLVKPSPTCSFNGDFLAVDYNCILVVFSCLHFHTSK